MSARGGRRSSWPELVAGAVAGLWGWRVELALVVLVAVVERGLAGQVGELTAAVVVLIVVVSVLSAGRPRRWLWRVLRRAWWLERGVER